MANQTESKSTLGALLFIICFVIGCLFLYWAVQYWVYNNFDKGRYEISKIQPAGGGDSMGFWKLDRRTGVVEYCTVEVVKDRATADAEKDPAHGREFTCLRATVLDSKEKDYYVKPEAKAETPASEPVAEQVVTTTATPAEPVAAPAPEAPAAAVVPAPEAPATPATPPQP